MNNPAKTVIIEAVRPLAAFSGTTDGAELAGGT